MKYASSIRYGGQLVEASECDYNSYKHLGLLCPECKDAVFLRAEGARSHNGKEVKVAAHFAHFAGKDAAIVAQCESRVSKYTPKQLQKMAAQARGQRLRLLQRWFWSVYISCHVPAIGDLTRFETIEAIESKIAAYPHCDETNTIKDLVYKKLDANYRGMNWDRIVQGSFDLSLAVNQNSATQYGKDLYARLAKVDARLQRQISHEVFGFVLRKTSREIFSQLMAYIFLYVESSDRLTNSVIAKKSLSKVVDFYFGLFVQFIVMVPWADEFAKLQNRETAKAA